MQSTYQAPVDISNALRTLIKESAEPACTKTRLINCLRADGILTPEALFARPENDLKKIPNLGKACWMAIRRLRPSKDSLGKLTVLENLERSAGVLADLLRSLLRDTTTNQGALIDPVDAIRLIEIQRDSLIFLCQRYGVKRSTIAEWHQVSIGVVNRVLK